MIPSAFGTAPQPEGLLRHKQTGIGRGREVQQPHSGSLARPEFC
jgi:hypothetical protein